MDRVVGVLPQRVDALALVVCARDERPTPERAGINDGARAQARRQSVEMPLRRHEDGCIETGDAIVERCAGNAAVVDVHEPCTGGVGELGRVFVPRLPRREIGVDEHAQLARRDRLL